MKNKLQRRLLTAIALLALLLQVQSVFACEMMERSGPVSECCCGEMLTGQEPDCGCCTLDTRVALKADTGDSPAALPTTQNSPDPQPLAAPPPSHGPPQAIPPPVARPTLAHSDHAHPGSRTWLATARLRI